MPQPTSSVKTVALAGAAGSLGKVVLDALLKANFTVTALVRPGSSSSFPEGVKTAPFDINDPASLQTTLSDQDALVSTVGFTGFLSQIPLIDAAVAAGVKRIIPSEFGADQTDAAVRALPVFAHKVQVETHLRAAVAAHPQTTFTLVANNEFLDWDLDNGFGVDIAGRKIEIFDGGDVPFTATPLPFVAAGVVGILSGDLEKTANRTVRLHGTTMTQNRLLALLQKHTGEPDGWTVTQTTTAEREKQAWAHLQEQPGDFAKWAIMFLHCSIYSQKFGIDFSGRNDNELLGLKELSEQEVEEIVRRRC